ncbi:MAG: cobalamin-dependent protein [Deltaproteobacteria bacterium]|nr:cobalamin-dependent protein [Deltaproteobacteria bacterium]
MRLVLVNPSFQQRIRRIAQTTVGPPLGLAYLAAAAREAGHDPRIVDANALGLNEAATVLAVLADAPRVVGITATTPTFPAAGRLAAALKRERPDLTVLVGGPHTTALPARSLAEHPAIDAVARGEAERTLPAVLAAIEAGGGPGGSGLVGGGLAEVPGVAFRRPDGTVTDTGVAPTIEDLDSIPVPARDLLPMRRYRSVDSDRFTTLLAMRGCPCKCVYCAVPPVFGRRMRYRSPGRVAAEMLAVRAEFGTDFFSFVDDTFTTKREWVEEFCEALGAGSGTGEIRWICLTRADMVDEALLRRMRAAGCVRVEFGIESGSATGRAFLKKGLSETSIVSAFEAARAAGLSTMGFAMLNVPGEGEADVAATFDLVRRADPDFLQVSFMTPYPGTPLWDWARERGLVATEDWERYVFLREVVLRNETMTPEQLQAQYARLVRWFWLRPATAMNLIRLVLSRKSAAASLGRTIRLGLAALVPWRGEPGPARDDAGPGRGRGGRDGG